jgi:PKD-like domain
MRNLPAFFSVILFLSFTWVVYGQTATPSPSPSLSPLPSPSPSPTPKIRCPALKLSGPAKSIQKGDSITFTVDLKGGRGNSNPSYLWTVSAGIITSGQGTPLITVSTDNVDSPITVKIEVGNISDCPWLNAKLTVQVRQVQYANNIDQWDWDISENSEKARLDSLTSQIQSDPGVRIAIIVYGKCRSSAKMTRDRITQIKNSLTSLQVNMRKVVVINGKTKSIPEIEVFIVPDGAPMPMPDSSDCH